MLNNAVSDGANLYLQQPKTIPLVSGSATFSLDATDFYKVSYIFSVYSLDSSNNATLLYSFQAQVPTSATPVNFSDLAKTIGVSQNLQDVSLTSISRLVYNSDTFWQKLKATIFVPKGNFDPALYYMLGDIVSYNGGSYLCASPVNIVGIYPNNAAYWQVIAAQGATGTGTGGNNAPYDATVWNNQLDAPSRGAIRNLVQTLATQAQLANYATLSNANLTSPKVVSDPSQNDRSTLLVSSQWVQTLLDVVRKSVLPVGTVANWAGTSAPLYWLLCDGSTVSIST